MYGYCLYILESVFILMNPSKEISKTGINSLIASMIILIKMNTWLIPSVPIGWSKIPPMVLHDDSKTNHQWLHDLYYLYICINVYYQEQENSFVVRSLETGRQASLWQCQKAQSNSPNCLKRTETFVLIYATYNISVHSIPFYSPDASCRPLNALIKGFLSFTRSLYFCYER
jgi:hypothetical protein